MNSWIFIEIYFGWMITQKPYQIEKLKFLVDGLRYLFLDNENFKRQKFNIIAFNINIILPQMQIFLHQLDGSQTIVEISQQIDLNTFITQNHLLNCRLICQGETINTTAQLLTLNNNANLFVTADLDGGKKKKKKKVYTTKKKNKHIHKKTPGATLTLYTVDGKGNVTQTRKTCPSCGPGIFMAQHWDRYYCGTCHTTIKMDAETIKKNEQIMKKKKAQLEAERKAKEKQLADKAPAGKGKKDAKKAGKKK